MTSMETDKRKVEAIKALLQDLSAGSADQVPVCLRTALERGWNEELPSYIHHFEEKKRDEVHRHCKRHYDEFLASVEDLLSVSSEADGLLREAETLVTGVDATAASAREKSEELAGLQAAQRHVVAAVSGVDECLVIVDAVERVESALAAGRFYSALSALDEVEGLLHGAKVPTVDGSDDLMEGPLFSSPVMDHDFGGSGGASYVQSLRNNAFVRRVDGWLRRLRARVMKKGMVEVNHWLLRIREFSAPVGMAASRRMAQHLLLNRGFELGLGVDDGEAGAGAAGRNLAFASYEAVPALRGLLRLAETLGFERWGDLGWLPECVPEIFKPRDAAAADPDEGRRMFHAGASLNLDSERVQAQLLDSLEEQLHSVHIGLLIHAHFQELEKFRTYYALNRLPQGELRALHTTSLASLPFASFFTDLPKVLAGIAGFYAVESKLLQEADAPAGLPDKEAYEDAWEATQADLIQTIKRQLEGSVIAAVTNAASSPEPPLLICLKEQLVTLLRTLADATMGTLDLNVEGLRGFIKGELRRAFDVAQKNWLRKEVDAVLQDEAWQPLFVNDVYDFNRLVAPLELHTVRGLVVVENGDADDSTAGGTFDADPFDDGMGASDAFLDAYDLDPLLRIVGIMLSQAVPRSSAAEGIRFPVTLPFSGGYCRIARAVHRYAMHCCAYNLGDRPKVARGAGEGDDHQAALHPADLADIGHQCQWLARSLETALIDVFEMLQAFMGVGGNERLTLSKACQLYLDSINMALLPDRFTPVLSDAMVNTLGRSLSASGDAQSVMDDALAIVGDTSRQAFEGLSQKARDIIYETLRLELGDLVGDLSTKGLKFWVPGVPAQHPHPWAADVITFLRVTFMTKLTFLPSDVRESLHYLACSHIHTVVLESLTGPEVQKVDLYGLYNLRLDVTALEGFADECGVTGLRECFSEARDLLGFLTDPRLEALGGDMQAVERKYPRMQKHKAAGVLRKLQNLNAAGLAQTATVNLPPVDKRKALVLSRALSQEG